MVAEDGSGVPADRMPTLFRTSPGITAEEGAGDSVVRACSAAEPGARIRAALRGRLVFEPA